MNKKTILIVDDEESNRKVIRECLEEFGYNVKSYENPAKAFADLKNGFIPNGFIPNLVITDSNMPELTGSQLSNGIRKILPEVPIIMITGRLSDVDPNNKVDLFMTKPISFRILKKIVDALMF